MRDDRSNWTPIRKHEAQIDGHGVKVGQISAEHQVLISGPTVCAAFPDSFGWPDIAAGPFYTLFVRRDRVLLVGAAHSEPEGWHSETGRAVSDATGAYEVFEVSGKNARSVLDQGGELHAPSNSVARLLFGFGVFLYRYESEDRYRIHVARAHGQALWQSLEGACNAGDGTVMCGRLLLCKG